MLDPELAKTLGLIIAAIFLLFAVFGGMYMIVLNSKQKSKRVTLPDVYVPETEVVEEKQEVFSKEGFAFSGIGEIEKPKPKKRLFGKKQPKLTQAGSEYSTETEGELSNYQNINEDYNQTQSYQPPGEQYQSHTYGNHQPFSPEQGHPQPTRLYPNTPLSYNNPTAPQGSPSGTPVSELFIEDDDVDFNFGTPGESSTQQSSPTPMQTSQIIPPSGFVSRRLMR